MFAWFFLSENDFFGLNFAVWFFSTSLVAQLNHIFWLNKDLLILIILNIVICLGVFRLCKFKSVTGNFNQRKSNVTNSVFLKGSKVTFDRYWTVCRFRSSMVYYLLSMLCWRSKSKVILLQIIMQGCTLGTMHWIWLWPCQKVDVWLPVK